jgi:hypothetical protein
MPCLRAAACAREPRPDTAALVVSREVRGYGPRGVQLASRRGFKTVGSGALVSFSRELIRHLQRDELLVAVDPLGLGVRDRRWKDALSDAVANAKADFRGLPDLLPRARLKELSTPS